MMRIALVLYTLFLIISCLAPIHGWVRTPAFSLWPPNILLIDALENLLLYIPFGYAAFALHARWCAILLLGMLLSLSLESLQAFNPARMFSLSDVAFNTVSTGIGILLARACHPWLCARFTTTAPLATLALSSWLLWQCYPWQPSLQPAQLHAALITLSFVPMPLPLMMAILTGVVLGLLWQRVWRGPYGLIGVWLFCLLAYSLQLIMQGVSLQTHTLLGQPLGAGMAYAWLRRYRT